jgi:hypothetical protein
MKPIPLVLISVLEVMLAIVIGLVFRYLIDLMVVLFSIKISATWIAVILGIPVFLIVLKVHYAFRRWLTKNGWVKAG